jgi:hypothetical protein
MQAFRTNGCAKHGHRELTLQFGDKPLIPNGERLLLSYFESAVAQGTQFKPGQTIAIGGQVLRLKDRSDGTLGIEELVPAPREEWIEQVDRTVSEVMIQRYTCDSVKLALAYPQPRASCLVAECAQEADTFLMTRVDIEGMPDHASGWMLSCTEQHEHGERMGLPLLALSALKPEAVKFLALPADTVVLVMPTGATVFHAGQQLTPLAGSYLEMHNARSSR